MVDHVSMTSLLTVLLPFAALAAASLKYGVDSRKDVRSW